MTQKHSEHYSGVLVTTLPGRLEGCIQALETRAGITIGIQEPERNRMIVVLEAASPPILESLHRSVRLLPGVVAAVPIVHYVDEEPGPSDPAAGSPDASQESPCSKP